MGEKHLNPNSRHNFNSRHLEARLQSWKHLHSCGIKAIMDSTHIRAWIHLAATPSQCLSSFIQFQESKCRILGSVMVIIELNAENVCSFNSDHCQKNIPRGCWTIYIMRFITDQATVYKCLKLVLLQYYTCKGNSKCSQVFSLSKSKQKLPLLEIWCKNRNY